MARSANRNPSGSTTQKSKGKAQPKQQKKISPKTNITGTPSSRSVSPALSSSSSRAPSTRGPSAPAADNTTPSALDPTHSPTTDLTPPQAEDASTTLPSSLSKDLPSDPHAPPEDKETTTTKDTTTPTSPTKLLIPLPTPNRASLSPPPSPFTLLPLPAPARTLKLRIIRPPRLSAQQALQPRWNGRNPARFLGGDQPPSQGLYEAGKKEVYKKMGAFQRAVRDAEKMLEDKEEERFVLLAPFKDAIDSKFTQDVNKMKAKSEKRVEGIKRGGWTGSAMLEAQKRLWSLPHGFAYHPDRHLLEPKFEAEDEALRAWQETRELEREFDYAEMEEKVEDGTVVPRATLEKAREHYEMKLKSHSFRLLGVEHPELLLPDPDGSVIWNPSSPTSKPIPPFTLSTSSKKESDSSLFPLSSPPAMDPAIDPPSPAKSIEGNTAAEALGGKRKRIGEDEEVREGLKVAKSIRGDRMKQGENMVALERIKQTGEGQKESEQRSGAAAQKIEINTMETPKGVGKEKESLLGGVGQGGGLKSGVGAGGEDDESGVSGEEGEGSEDEEGEGEGVARLTSAQKGKGKA